MLIEADGKRIAYVTDTTPQRESKILDRIANVDLLMHECYFSDNFQELSLKTGHSWISAVTEIVQKTKPKRTLLIHVNPLAEVLKQSIELTELHQSLSMQFAEDEMIVDV